MAGFLFLLFTERLQGVGDLMTKVLIGLILGVGVWLITEQITWRILNGMRRKSHRKTKHN